ncbi:hypothetical protein F5146DRAFT_994339 [Armillaria mellea]|nr:hypothetical protein F5146DRAFT_994339 [Armillaria mellea]
MKPMLSGLEGPKTGVCCIGWLIGQLMTLFQYYLQIQTLLQQMHTAAEQTLPANRAFMDAFLGAFPFRHLDNLLLERQYLIIKYCHSNVIHPGILWSSLQSVDIIMDAVGVRVNDLQAIFKHKNLDEAVMMCKSVYGLFSSWGWESQYYKLNKHALSGLELISELPLEIDQTSIDFINLKPTLLCYTTSDNDTMDGQPNNADSMSSKLPAILDRNKEIYELEGFSAVIGTWVGDYHHKGLGVDGMAVFCITDTHTDGNFEGFGTRDIGEFTIQGKLSSRGSDSTRVIFNESLKGLAADKWRYEGTITSSGVMEGQWGSENDQEGTDDFETTKWTTQDSIIGQFSFEHCPIERYLDGFWPEHEYQDLVLQYGPSCAYYRARWGYAIRVVLHRIRRSYQEMHWSHLKERRDQRRQFIDLIIQRDCHAISLPYIYSGPVNWDMMDTLALLERSLYLQDILQLYHSLAWFKARRQIMQSSNGITCNACKKYIIGTRFICLNCLLEYGDDSTDFCVRCYREDFKNDKVVHTRYHPLLQLRHCLATRPHEQRWRRQEQGSEIHQDIRNAEIANKVCRRLVGSASTAKFFLCIECNAKDNATEPWMTDKHLRPEEGHTYVHKLVLCPEPKPDEPKVLSVEERLAAMEKHMEVTKKHTETYIQTVEMHIEETKKHAEVSQRSLQELFEFQKENSAAIQKRIEKMLTCGAGLIVLIFAIWAAMMRGWWAKDC